MHKPYSYKSYIYITCNIYIMIIVHKMYIVIYLICKYLNMPTYLIDFRMAYDCYGMAGLVWFILLRQIVWQRQALGGTVNHQGVSLCNTAPKSRQESSNHHQQIINKSSTNHQPSSTNHQQILIKSSNSRRIQKPNRWDIETAWVSSVACWRDRNMPDL